MIAPPSLGGDVARRRLRLAEPVPVTDDELLVAVSRGDQQAFSELYDRFAARVFGIVRRVVRDPAQSEEVAQEVFVSLWRTATRFDPDRAAPRRGS
jgi:RNA polymerase sigma-70 factor, ECF subfamily